MNLLKTLQNHGRHSMSNWFCDWSQEFKTKRDWSILERDEWSSHYQKLIPQLVRWTGNSLPSWTKRHLTAYWCFGLSTTGESVVRCDCHGLKTLLLHQTNHDMYDCQLLFMSKPLIPAISFYFTLFLIIYLPIHWSLSKRKQSRLTIKTTGEKGCKLLVLERKMLEISLRLH